MPILKRRLGEKQILVIPATVSNHSFLRDQNGRTYCVERLYFSNTMFNTIVAKQVAQHPEHGLWCKNELNRK